MKYRGKDNSIADRATNRATTHARVVEAESSQLRARRVVPTGSHWK